MPDWSYQTVLRPLLFRLSPKASRDLSLELMGTLAKTPLGPALIDLLGHMKASTELAHDAAGITVPSPVGLGNGIDLNGVALRALARFGFGFLEVGPVTLEPLTSNAPIQRRPRQSAIAYPDPLPNPGAARLIARLPLHLPRSLPLVVGLGYAANANCKEATGACETLVEQFAPYADLFTLWTTTAALRQHWTNERWKEHLQRVIAAIRSAERPRGLLLQVPPDLEPDRVDHVIDPALALGITGIVVAGGVRENDETRLWGRPAYEPALHQLARLRARLGEVAMLIAGGGSGIHEPIDALEMLDAGATAVQIDTGLVYGGPGLPKRCNEAVQHYRSLRERKPPVADTTPPHSAPKSAWLWAMLMGAGMLFGGMLAMLIASTRVVLPYDESLIGLSRAEIHAVNPRLLHFMTHDRVSLAGTMIAVGTLYFLLSLFAIRRGQHWAWVTVLASAFPGFFTFFLFLGFGYFDPFHAFVSAVLLQFLLLTLHAPLPAPVRTTLPNLRSDRRWRLSVWGQLLFVIEGAVLIVAGLVISFLGITTVLVPEDLEFMQTSAEALKEAHPNLLPLIAHDRATFGGMLLACGIAVLLSSLWGFRQGENWLWWMLLISGGVGYVAAIVVHWAVGYTNLWHLTPAYSGLAIHLLAAGLSYPFLCAKDPALEADWKRFPPIESR